MFDKAMLRRAALSALILAAAAAPAFAATMQCAPNQVVQTTYPTGSTYTAAADGIVLNVANNDIDPLSNAGCVTVGVGGGPTLIGRLIGANMNVTTDQAIPMFLAPGASYTPTALITRNCSASLTAAQGGVYSAASKSGLVIGATTTPFTGCTATGLTSNVFPTATTQAAAVNPGTAFLSLTTAQGAAATADIYIYGYVYP